MKTGQIKRLVFIAVFTLLCVILASPMVRSAQAASGITVSWTIANDSGMPVDGAKLTIYYATSPNGPFTKMPADTTSEYIIDEINGCLSDPPKILGPRQNPIVSGYWNPDHPHGMAIASIRVSGTLPSHWFYVKIEYDEVTEYWPQMNSIKPGDAAWAPVIAGGSPTGCAAAGNGIGNGPTTGYPNHSPPDNVVPEVPLGPAIAVGSMGIGLIAYVGFRRRKATVLP